MILSAASVLMFPVSNGGESSTSQPTSAEKPAFVVGMDFEVKLSNHLSLTPQWRWHTFPYPEVSIVRPGVGLRWNF